MWWLSLHFYGKIPRVQSLGCFVCWWDLCTMAAKHTIYGLVRRVRYGPTRSSARSFAHKPHRLACSALLASLARCAVLTRSLTLLIRSLIPWLVGKIDIWCPHSNWFWFLNLSISTPSTVYCDVVCVVVFIGWHYHSCSKSLWKLSLTECCRCWLEDRLSLVHCQNLFFFHRVFPHLSPRIFGLWDNSSKGLHRW